MCDLRSELMSILFIQQSVNSYFSIPDTLIRYLYLLGVRLLNLVSSKCNLNLNVIKSMNKKPKKTTRISSSLLSVCLYIYLCIYGLVEMESNFIEIIEIV